MITIVGLKPPTIPNELDICPYLVMLSPTTTDVATCCPRLGAEGAPGVQPTAIPAISATGHSVRRPMPKNVSHGPERRMKTPPLSESYECSTTKRNLSIHA